MPDHMLKLLALSTILAVSPASAAQRAAPPASNHQDRSACPREQARIAAAAKAGRAQKGETRITLTGGAVSGRWLFGLLDAPRDLTP